MTSLSLVLLLVMFILYGCAIGSPKNAATPPKFRPELYPDMFYYVGVGIVQQKDEGRARDEAKLKAKERLVAQIAQTTVTSIKNVHTSDDGSKQESVFKETVNESFIQEIEGVKFIEENFKPKSGEQVTYAVLSKREWETQKLTKIEKERIQAQAILSERYPGISATKEIAILNRAIALLEERVWGSLIEDRFDDTHGNLLALSRARINHLYPQVLQSTRVYHVFEGISTHSHAEAKSIAGARFRSYLCERLIGEYRPKQIRYGADIEVREEIPEYVDSFMNRHPTLFEYFLGPDSHPGSWQVYLAVSRALVDEMLNKDIDALHLQVHSFKQEFEGESSVGGKLTLLSKIRALLSTSFIGLAVEEELFGNGERSLQAIEESIIKSVELSIDVTPTVQSGAPFVIMVKVDNSMDLNTSIPVKLQVVSSNNQNKLDKSFTLNSTIPQMFPIEVPAAEKANSYTITLAWENHPEIAVKRTIPIAKQSRWTKFLNWLGFGKRDREG